MKILHNKPKVTGELKDQVWELVYNKTCKEMHPHNRTNVMTSLKNETMGLNQLVRLLDNIGYCMSIEIIKK